MTDRGRGPIAVLYGSVRSARAGLPAARFLARTLEARGRQAEIVDVAEHPLPMLDKMFKEYAPGAAPEPMARVAAILDRADAVILVSGEYNHSIPPALKNLLDHFQAEYLFKPSGICTYSAGPFGGVRAAVHLRAILGELGAISVSTMLPIPTIADQFDADGRTENPRLVRGAGKFLDELLWWADAARAQREATGRPF